MRFSRSQQAEIALYGQRFTTYSRHYLRGPFGEMHDLYVGKTLRAVSVSRSNTIRHGHGSKSTIAEHVHNQFSLHEMDWSIFFSIIPLSSVIKHWDFQTVRKKEHRDAVRKGDGQKSAVAEPILQNETPHDIDWTSLKVVDGARKTRERRIGESIPIRKRDPTLNRDRGVEFSSTWEAVLWCGTDYNY